MDRAFVRRYPELRHDIPCLEDRIWLGRRRSEVQVG
jgi:hypothetical protein